MQINNSYSISADILYTGYYNITILLYIVLVNVSDFVKFVLLKKVEYIGH